MSWGSLIRADYWTYRRVFIHKSAVGGVWYVLLLCAVLAVALNIVVYQGYLQHEPVRTVRFVRTLPPNNLSAFECANDALAEKDRVAAICSTWDWLEMVDASRDSVLVTTYVEDVLERRVCPRSASSCTSLSSVFEPLRTAAVLVAAPEAVELEVAHRALPRSDGGGGVTAASVSRGWFGEREIYPGGADRISVADFLRAAGVGRLTPTQRRQGVHIDVSLSYSNVHGFWGVSAEPRYVYAVALVPASTEAHMITSLSASPFIENATSEAAGDFRIVRTQFGVKLTFHDAGSLAAPSLHATLSFLVSCAVVLSLPAQLVEVVLTLLPAAAPAMRMRLPTWYRRLVEDAPP